MERTRSPFDVRKRLVGIRIGLCRHAERGCLLPGHAGAGFPLRREVLRGVKTTGIYCRPRSARRRLANRENVEFFAIPVLLAEKERLPACLRCRPEAAPQSPAWSGKIRFGATGPSRPIAGHEHADLGCRGFRGPLRGQLPAPARLFAGELGNPPSGSSGRSCSRIRLELIRGDCVAHSAKIAFASGFASVRRFNDAVRKRFQRPPSRLRRRGADAPGNGPRPATSFSPPDGPPLPLGRGSEPCPSPSPMVIAGLETFADGACNPKGLPLGRKPRYRASYRTRTHLRPAAALSAGRPGAWVRAAVSVWCGCSTSIPIRSSSPTPFRKRPPGTSCTAASRAVQPARLGRLRNRRVRHPGAIGEHGAGQPHDRPAGGELREGRPHPITGAEYAGFSVGRKGWPPPPWTRWTTGSSPGGHPGTLRAGWCPERPVEEDQDPAAFRKDLLDIKGIGPWTAEYISLRLHRGYGRLCGTDLILKRVLERHPDIDLECARPWRGERRRPIHESTASCSNCFRWPSRPLD